MRKAVILISVILFLVSCSSTEKKVRDYIIGQDKDFISAVYTNEVEKLNKLNDYNIKPTPHDLRFIDPYNNLIVLFDTIPDTVALRKDFPFSKIVLLKKVVIIDNSLSKDSIANFLSRNVALLKQMGIKRFYTTHKQRLNFLKKDFSIDGFVIKWFGKDRLNPKYSRILNTAVRNTLRGKTFIVYFDDTDTLRHPSIKEVKRKLEKSNILRLKDGYIFMPVWAFRHDALDSLKKYISKYNDVKIVYTDITWLLKNKLPESIIIKSLPRRYNKKGLNENFLKLLLNIKSDVDKNKAVIYQYNITDTLLPSLKDYKKYFSISNIELYPDGLFIYSSFIDTPLVVRKLNEKIREDSGLVQRIYTNKVYLLKRYLDTNYNIRLVWEPRQCELKDTVCYPKKDFRQRLFRYKLDVEENKAYWLHFNDPASVEFPKTKFLKSYLINSLYYEGKDGIIFSSPYTKSKMLKALKDKLIPLYDSSANFKIYSNKIYVLEKLVDTGYTYLHLPVKYLLPSYEENTKLDNQLRRVRLDMTINNAIVVYFRDTSDSIYPPESYMREKFRYFKFYNFKEGFVIGRFFGD